MINRKTILTIIILLLLFGIGFFGYKYLASQKALEATKATLKTQQINEDVLGFTKLFIEKVLIAKSEVDFETRLKLENAVRNLDDEEILTQWQKFIESKAEDEAQENVKHLLEMLVNEIKVQ